MYKQSPSCNSEGRGSKHQTVKNLSYNSVYFEIEKQACEFDIPLSCPPKNHSVSKHEVDASGTIHRIVSEALHVGVNFTEMTVPVQVSKSPLSNQKEFPSEIDIDVPNFLILKQW